MLYTPILVGPAWYPRSKSFSVLKQLYGYLVRAKVALGVHHVNEPLFLELFFEADTRHSTRKTLKVALQ